MIRIARGLDDVPADQAKAMAEYAAALNEDPVDTDLQFQDVSGAVVPAIRFFAALTARCRKTDYKEESDAFWAFQGQLASIKGSIGTFSAGPDDKYSEVMSKFVETADFQIEHLAEVCTRVSERFAKVKEVFGELKAESEDLIKVFYDFSDACLD